MLTKKVEKMFAKRVCKCCACGETLVKGTELWRAYTPTHVRGESICLSCAEKLMAKQPDVISHMNEHPSTHCVNHEVVVLAPIDLYNFAYFMVDNKWDTMKPIVDNYSGKYAEYSVKAINRYNTGHVISECLSRGCMVMVNGVRIKTFEEFDEMTRI